MLLRVWVSVVYMNAFSVVFGSDRTGRTKWPSVCAVAGGRQAVRYERVLSTKLRPLLYHGNTVMVVYMYSGQRRSAGSAQVSGEQVPEMDMVFEWLVIIVFW